MVTSLIWLGHLVVRATEESSRSSSAYSPSHKSEVNISLGVRFSFSCVCECVREDILWGVE